MNFQLYYNGMFDGINRTQEDAWDAAVEEMIKGNHCVDVVDMTTGEVVACAAPIWFEPYDDLDD